MSAQQSNSFGQDLSARQGNSYGQDMSAGQGNAYAQGTSAGTGPLASPQSPLARLRACSPLLQQRPNACSPLARPTPNCSPDVHRASEGSRPCEAQMQPGLTPFALEQSKPPPPMQEPGHSAQFCARDNDDSCYPNSPLARHCNSSGPDSPPQGAAISASPAYPPSPVAHILPVARGNDRPPRSPLRRKDCGQRSSCSMGALPVLGPLPSLSRCGPR